VPASSNRLILILLGYGVVRVWGQCLDAFRIRSLRFWRTPFCLLIAAMSRWLSWIKSIDLCLVLLLENIKVSVVCFFNAVSESRSFCAESRLFLADINSRLSHGGGGGLVACFWVSAVAELTSKARRRVSEKRTGLFSGITSSTRSCEILRASVRRVQASSSQEMACLDRYLRTVFLASRLTHRSRSWVLSWNSFASCRRAFISRSDGAGSELSRLQGRLYRRSTFAICSRLGFAFAAPRAMTRILSMAGTIMGESSLRGCRFLMSLGSVT